MRRIEEDGAGGVEVSAGGYKGNPMCDRRQAEAGEGAENAKMRREG